MNGAGICKEVLLEVQGIMVTQNFFPLELGSADVVPGIE